MKVVISFLPPSRSRSRGAAAHAAALDPGNSYAQVALATLLSRMGNWGVVEHALRAALGRYPDNEEYLVGLGILMMQVGRVRDATAAFERGFSRHGPSPRISFLRAISLWSAGRLDEADRAINEAATLYPAHVGVWFTRFNMLLYAGIRPSGIPEGEFDLSAADRPDARRSPLPAARRRHRSRPLLARVRHPPGLPGP